MNSSYFELLYCHCGLFKSSFEHIFSLTFIVAWIFLSSSVIFDSEKMQSLRTTVLSYMRIRVPVKGRFIAEDRNATHRRMPTLLRTCSTAASINHDQVMDRVIGLVKKFDKIDSAKVINYLVLLLWYKSCSWAIISPMVLM